MTTINLDGTPVVPSFRVARGETKWQLDLIESYVIMHPYDIVQKLAEAGNITQAFAALDGFMRREIDIKTDGALDRIDRMYTD